MAGDRLKQNVPSDAEGSKRIRKDGSVVSETGGAGRFIFVRRDSDLMMRFVQADIIKTKYSD